MGALGGEGVYDGRANALVGARHQGHAPAEPWIDHGPVYRPPLFFRYLSSSESVDRINQVLSSTPPLSVSSVFRNW
jgi:hypothetical protein